MTEKNADAIQTVQSLVAEGRLGVEPYLTLRHEIEVSLYGETYENREAIKAAGFRWNGRKWSYAVSPSREDAMLMAFARDYTERKLEQAEESARRAALTDEEREAEDAERRRAAERSVAGERRGLSRKMRARGLAK